LASSVAFAGTIDADLATAENAYASLDYVAAESAADSVLAQRGLSHDVLTRATRVAALSKAALGHGDQARVLFTTLLEYDPDFKVDGKLGPRFTEPFSEARGFWQAQGRKPAMEIQVIAHYGEPGRIRTGTVDPLNIVKRVAVSFRWAPAREYTTTVVDSGARTIDVPASPEKSGRLEYYARALDAKENAIFEEGSADVPKAVVVAEPTRAGAQDEKKSIFGSPVFWSVTGVILAGAAVGGYFALRPTDYAAPTAARGSFTAACGGERCN
jgi:hypothetical protein